MSDLCIDITQDLEFLVEDQLARCEGQLGDRNVIRLLPSEDSRVHAKPRSRSIKKSAYHCGLLQVMVFLSLSWNRSDDASGANIGKPENRPDRP